MLLNKVELPVLYEFLKSTYGAILIVHETPRGDELARFMLGDSFFWIRRHGEDAQGVDVFSSDKKRLEEVELQWSVAYRAHIMEDMKEFEDGQSQENETPLGGDLQDDPEVGEGDSPLRSGEEDQS